MQRLIALLTLVCLILGDQGMAGEKKTRILLLGKDRDHPFKTHEYMTDCEILAKCLRQTPGVEPVVSNGWPKDPSLTKDVKAIVLHTQNGGNVLFNPLIRGQVEDMLKSGVGLTAIHWSTGADDKFGDPWLQNLGGWFSTKFSKLATRTAKLQQVDTKHPISRGWKEFDLRDEYYLLLKFQPDIKPVLQVNIDGKEHTVGWVYERAGKGRSFGFVCGHFHDNFGEQGFRQAIVNGILWTANLDVPEQGAPCAIMAKDMELPPDTRKK